MRLEKSATITTVNASRRLVEISMMVSNAEPSEGFEALENEAVHREEPRRRILTDKGRQYHLNLKIKDLKVIKQVRSTLLLRGQSEREYVMKQGLSVAQVLLGEFHDIFNSFSASV